MYHINKTGGETTKAKQARPITWMYGECTSNIDQTGYWIAQRYQHIFFGLTGAWGSFFLFRSVPFQYVCSFRFGFSHKPKSKHPDGQPLFFFSHPRPNVSRLRRPGAARAQPRVPLPFLHLTSLVCFRENKSFRLHAFVRKTKISSYKPLLKSNIITFTLSLFTLIENEQKLT